MWHIIKALLIPLGPHLYLVRSKAFNICECIDISFALFPCSLRVIHKRHRWPFDYSRITSRVDICLHRWGGWRPTPRRSKRSTTTWSHTTPECRCLITTTPHGISTSRTCKKRTEDNTCVRLTLIPWKVRWV
jgi:hypothetical protein